MTPMICTRTKKRLDVRSFLFACVERTIVSDLPKELHHLRAYDQAKARLTRMMDMPDMMMSLLINAITQNDFRLSKKRRKRDFPGLTDEQVASIEAIVVRAFTGDGSVDEEDDDDEMSIGVKL